MASNPDVPLLSIYLQGRWLRALPKKKDGNYPPFSRRQIISKTVKKSREKFLKDLGKKILTNFYVKILKDLGKKILTILPQTLDCLPCFCRGRLKSERGGVVVGCKRLRKPWVKKGTIKILG